MDLDVYRDELERRLSKVHGVMRIMIHKAQQTPKRVVFPEGEESKILRAAQILIDEKIATAHPARPRSRAFASVWPICTSLSTPRSSSIPHNRRERSRYADELYRLRQRKGVTRNEADDLIRNHNYFASIMVAIGDADALVGGLTQHYPDTIRPGLEVIPMRDGLRRVSGLYLMITIKRHLFLRRRHREHRAVRRRSGGDRDFSRRNRRAIQREAARRAALLLQLRKHPASRWPTRFAEPWSW